LAKLEDVEVRRSVVTQILKDVYDRQQKTFMETELMAKYLYVLEEAQTVMSTYAIRKGFLQDYFSTCRNYHTSNIAICQRLSEISPKIREKIPNCAFGFTRGSNNLRHIRDITDKTTREQVKKLGEYKFILFANSKKYKVKANIEAKWHIEDVLT